MGFIFHCQLPFGGLAGFEGMPGGDMAATALSKAARKVRISDLVTGPSLGGAHADFFLGGGVDGPLLTGCFFARPRKVTLSRKNRRFRRGVFFLSFFEEFESNQSSMDQIIMTPMDQAIDQSNPPGEG